MAAYELTGSVSDKERGFIETWENVSVTTNYIIRENRRGDEQYFEIKGPQKFKLSTYDRMLTQDKIVETKNDPFTNGAFRPVVVPSDVTIESNPNAMSNEDIKSVFTCSDVAWDEYMDVIDSPATLQRMVDMADQGEAELSHRRYKQLESMIERLSRANNPAGRIVQKDQATYDAMKPAGGSNIEQPSATRRARAATKATP